MLPPVENSEEGLLEESDSNGTASNLIQNPSFENGSTPWIKFGATIMTAPITVPAHTGVYMAVLGEPSGSFEDIYQKVTIPKNAISAKLEFWYRVVSTETTTSKNYDFFAVMTQDAVNISDMAMLTSLSNLNKSLVWAKSQVFDMAAYKGRTINLTFATLGDSSNDTYFLIDDVSLTVTMSTNNTVVEFYNTTLDNYFITADSNEATQIDSGSAGPGWSRTGNTFKSGGNASVCRFYGSMAPGPNSHFYTVSPAECANLKAQQESAPATQKRWNFESMDFISTAPDNQICSVGTVPVYRAYNNGFARGVDSNHRITSNQTAIQEVVAKGWSNEGVVMCAPL